ncbi:Hsp20/alpha crystallin family protein [Adhaeribacter aquaticus]|uniref:Hsp20/alpha crystallin family protein n=1 Tax=Adhaeribacter aquaticus TaxID=299567 RepID=UPI0004070AE4|nr:Hsp20/alpha crystallin family protein [Adhaeribacter aquaticus]
MTLVKLNSNLVDRLPETYGSVIDKFFNEGLSTHRRNLTKFYPQVDSIETEKEFQLQVALPGVKKENVHLEFEEGRLTISGERKFDTDTKDKKYHFVETNYGSFKRAFNLPENIQEAGIEARFEDGILTVVIPKDEKKVAKRQIEVK